MQFDLKITGGTVVDGSGAPRFRADFGVKDGHIAAIGQLEGGATEEIDASGLVVSPGFIDCHTHYDAQVLWGPMLTGRIAGKVLRSGSDTHTVTLDKSPTVVELA